MNSHLQKISEEFVIVEMANSTYRRTLQLTQSEIETNKKIPY